MPCGGGRREVPTMPDLLSGGGIFEANSILGKGVRFQCQRKHEEIRSCVDGNIFNMAYPSSWRRQKKRHSAKLPRDRSRSGARAKLTLNLCVGCALLVKLLL